MIGQESNCGPSCVTLKAYAEVHVIVACEIYDIYLKSYMTKII